MNSSVPPYTNSIRHSPWKDSCTFPVKLEEGDVSDIVCLEGQCFPTSWTENQFIQGFRNGVLHACGLRTEEAGLIAYVTFHFAGDEVEIINIGVNPGHRCKGHGFRLLNLLLKICSNLNVKKIFLEVRRTNEAARRLYKKAGFTKVGVRKGYYQDTKEDAIIMCYTFPKE